VPLKEDPVDSGIGENDFEEPTILIDGFDLQAPVSAVDSDSISNPRISENPFDGDLFLTTLAASARCLQGDGPCDGAQVAGI
jgi:hypothetical protein